jgi:RND family efflux transporter MFP subunit
MKMRRRHRDQSFARNAALAALVLAGALGTAGCGGGGKTEAAEAPAALPSVAVIRAATDAVETAVVVSGNLTPQTRVDVHAKLGGTLDKVFVQLGQHVSAGSVLATLDRREIDAQVDAAEAAVNVARAGLEAADAAVQNASQELERAKNLFDKGAIARQRLDAAETTARSSRAQRDLAKANVAQAEAAMRRAREVQRDATLRAPVSGVVVERNFDAGNLVGPGSDRPVVAVADIRTLKLEAGVSELDAGRLQPGSVASITLPAKPGQTYEGRLVAIAPEVDTRNRHFQIEIRVDNRSQELLSGMYATARMVVARAEGVVVPREAIFDKEGRRVVYRLQGDRLELAQVAEGLTDGSRTQIVSGLAPGEVVVADARREIAEGARVRPIAAK